MATQDDFIRTALRVPPDLHKLLHSAATTSNRTFNAEIVARLQQSFRPAVQSGEVEAIAAERDQQRALAQQFRSITDSTDTLRTLLAKFHLATLEKLRAHDLEKDGDDHIERICAQWLTESDPRGAAFSILRLIDGSSPEVVESLRKFASQLEDLGMVRKPIVLIKAGAHSKPKRAERSVNKVLLVGNLGADPELRYLPENFNAPPGNPPQNNKGPIRRTRNKPPK